MHLVQEFQSFEEWGTISLPSLLPSPLESNVVNPVKNVSIGLSISYTEIKTYNMADGNGFGK